MLFIFKKIEFLMISRSFGYKMQCLCKRRKKLISSSNRMHAGIACRVFSCSTYEGSRTRINMGVAFLRTSHLLAYIESIHVSLPYLHLIYKLDRSFFRLAVAKISTSQILDRCPSKFVFVHAKTKPSFKLC